MASFKKKRYSSQKILDQFPVLLQALSGALQAGYSVPQAFDFVESEIEDPLRSVVQEVNVGMGLQQPLEEVLPVFIKACDHPDIRFFVESTLMQVDSGGDLVDLWERVRYVFEENRRLERDRKSFTSQGRLSGIIIAGLWPLSLVFFIFFAPTQAEMLLHTSMGRLLLGFSLFLEAMGFIWIWRIARINTGIT